MNKKLPNISLETIGNLLDSKLKPVHGEIAKVTRELRELKLESMRTSAATYKIERELVRIDSNIETLNEKSDATLVDINDLQETTKAIWDAITIEAEKAKREIGAIKKHIGFVNNQS